MPYNRYHFIITLHSTRIGKAIGHTTDLLVKSDYIYIMLGPDFLFERQYILLQRVQIG